MIPKHKDDAYFEKLDTEMANVMRDQAIRDLTGQLPKGWDSIPERYPAQPKKAKVTIRLDAEVAKFYRKMGVGHQARMNAVLRLFMLAVMTGHIPGKFGFEDNWPWWRKPHEQIL